MLACVLLFTAIDMMMHVDVLGWLPVDTRNVLDACGVVKIRIISYAKGGRIMRPPFAVARQQAAGGGNGVFSE